MQSLKSNLIGETPASLPLNARESQPPVRDDPNLPDIFRLSVQITDNHRITIPISRNNIYYPVFARLLIEQRPDVFGSLRRRITSSGFYEDLNQLETDLVAARKFITNQDELGTLFALKNHLLKPLISNDSFASTAEKNIYIRRLLKFAARLKKLPAKHKPEKVVIALRNLETQSLQMLARNYFQEREYSLAEAIFVRLLDRIKDISDNALTEEARSFVYNSFLHLAKIHQNNKNYIAAENCYQKAIKYFSPLLLFIFGDFQADLKLFTLIAQVYLKKDQKQKAIDLFEKSIASSQKFISEIQKFKSEREQDVVSSNFLSFPGIVEEVRDPRMQAIKWIEKSKEIISDLQRQIVAIQALVTRLKAECHKIEDAKEEEGELEAAPQDEETEPKKTDSKREAACLSPTGSSATSTLHQPSSEPSARSSEPSARSSEYETMLTAATFPNKMQSSKKPKKKLISSPQPSSSSTTGSVESKIPVLAPRPNCISRYILNHQSGAQYIFHLDQKHLQTYVIDSKIKTRLEIKFSQAEFIAANGKQGFKYAAHQEKAIALGYFIKLKLFGEEGLGNIRLWGRLLDSNTEDNIKEVIFDGIDLNAHSNASMIIKPVERKTPPQAN